MKRTLEAHRGLKNPASAVAGGAPDANLRS